jgi:hypothetical protein
MPAGTATGFSPDDERTPPMTNTMTVAATDRWRGLRSPMSLSPDGSPGIAIEDGFVSCEPTRMHGARRYWRVTITDHTGGALYDAVDDISHPIRASRDADQARDVITTVIALLTTDAVRYSNTPASAVGGWMFDIQTARWAARHRYALSRATEQLAISLIGA